MKASLVAILFLPLALVQSDSTGPCVASCETTSPASSFCDGTETGAALDQCTCQSLVGTNLITCINACPSDQISSFAAGVPALCRGQLFPGVSVSSTGAAATTSSPSPAGTGTGTSGTTTASTSSASSSSTSTTSVHAGGNGAGRNIALDMSLGAAIMGGVFALLM